MIKSDDGSKTIRWIARILATAFLLFGLPFYFGYGNPLPFVSPGYTLWDNVWLTIFPVVFVGLAVGWLNEKVGGLLIVIPIIIGFMMVFVADKDISPHMLIPFIVGVLYILSNKEIRKKTGEK